MNIEHYENRVLRVYDRRALLVRASDALVFRADEHLDLTTTVSDWLQVQISHCLGERTLANMELREAKAGMLVHEMEQPYLAELAVVGLEMFGIDRKEVYTYAQWCLEAKQYHSAQALLKLADLMLEHERSELRQVSAMVSQPLIPERR